MHAQPPPVARDVVTVRLAAYRATRGDMPSLHQGLTLRNQFSCNFIVARRFQSKSINENLRLHCISLEKEHYTRIRRFYILCQNSFKMKFRKELSQRDHVCLNHEETVVVKLKGRDAYL